MKAAVIHGPGKITCDNVDDPSIEQRHRYYFKSYRNSNMRFRSAHIFRWCCAAQANDAGA